MMTGPLALPVDIRPRARRSRRLRLRTAAWAVVVVAALGPLAWYSWWSPLGYSRFDVFDRSAVVDLDADRSYVVFEEFDGASSPKLPTPIAIDVSDEAGRPVATRAVQAPGKRAAVRAYDVAGREGRAVAEFRPSRSGEHEIEVVFVPGGAGRYRPFGPLTVAVGDPPSSAWLAGPYGFAVSVAAPSMVAAAALFFAARRSGRRPGADGPATPGSDGA